VETIGNLTLSGNGGSSGPGRPSTPSVPNGARISGLPFFGPPNSSSHTDGPDGQIRDYDHRGIPKTDYDFGHPGHHPNLGCPHAHDWEVVDGELVRGGGRDVGPNELPPGAVYVFVGSWGAVFAWVAANAWWEVPVALAPVGL
jgi:hypothetical protein